MLADKCDTPIDDDLFRKETISPTEIKTMDGLCPKKDDVFLFLLEKAIAGEVSVYFAAVPFHLVEPFDKEYDPASHPVGRKVVDKAFQEWKQGRFSTAWVYPRGGRYILSDDYVILAAARHGQPDYVPCWVIGEPPFPGCKDVQGPIEKEKITQMLSLDQSEKGH